MSRANTVRQEQDFNAAWSGALETQHRDAQERLEEMELEARRAIVGQTFRFRDAMLCYLVEQRKAQLGRSLSMTETHMERAITIGLWGDYAREHGLDVRMISESQYEQVQRALAQAKLVMRHVDVGALVRSLKAEGC